MNELSKYVTPEHKAILASWSRAFLAAALALVMAGVTDPSTLFNAGLAAVVPVAIRYFNKKDPAFGKVAEVILTKVVEETAKAPAKKAPAKKATARKPE